MIWSFVGGALTVIVHVFVVLWALHYRKASPMLIHASSAVAIHGISLFLGAYAGNAFSYWHMAAVFWFGVMSYLFFYSAFYKSVSLRLLCALADAEGGRLARITAYQQVIRPGFDERAGLLLEGGYVARSARGFVVTPAGRRVAERLRAARRVLAIRNGGIYFS